MTRRHQRPPRRTNPLKHRLLQTRITEGITELKEVKQQLRTPLEVRRLGGQKNGTYTGVFTEVVLESVACGQRTVEEVIEMKRFCERRVNECQAPLDDAYYTSVSEALTALQAVGKDPTRGTPRSLRYHQTYEWYEAPLSNGLTVVIREECYRQNDCDDPQSWAQEADPRDGFDASVWLEDRFPLLSLSEAVCAGLSQQAWKKLGQTVLPSRVRLEACVLEGQEEILATVYALSPSHAEETRFITYLQQRDGFLVVRFHTVSS